MILFHCQLEISSYFLHVLDDISRVDRCAGDLFLLFESNGTSVAEAGLNIIEILKIQSWTHMIIFFVMHIVQNILLSLYFKRDQIRIHLS